MANIEKDLLDLLRKFATDSKIEFKISASELAKLMQASTDRLKLASGQPGFQEAVVAEVEALAIRAGVKVVGSAEAADARAWSLFQAALAIGVAAL